MSLAWGGAGGERGGRSCGVCSIQLLVLTLFTTCTNVVPLAGDGWSSRAEDAILHGCIPLVIMDDVHAGVNSVNTCGVAVLLAWVRPGVSSCMLAWAEL